MAIVTLTPSVAPADGSGAVTVARTGSLSSANTYRFANDGATVLLFEKTGAGSCTVVVTTTAEANGMSVTDPIYTVPASTGDVVIGPFACSVFNDENGFVSFNVSQTTGLTVGIVQVPKR